MEPFNLTSAIALAVGAFGLLALGIWAARRRRPGLAAAHGPAVAAPEAAIPAPEAMIHRVELRMEAIEALQAALAARLEGLGGDDAAERRLQAMAGQILGLVRDKDASLEVALAGLDQMRARMRLIEQIGEPAEARALFERFGVRLDALDVAQAAVEARLAGLAVAETPFAAISEQLTRLYAQKDATVETVFARLAPLEAKLASVEGALVARDPQAALERFAERLEAARAAQEAAVTALGARVTGLEGAENPFAAISEQLTRLYAQKDATVETVFARLAPLEAKLGEIEGALAARDPQGALDRFAERLEALQGRVVGLEVAETPFAAISEQLTRLYAQKDATVETVFARLAPLEAKLASVEGALVARDPQAALERFAERLEAARAAQEAAVTALGARVTGLEGAENPFAAISEQLTRLYAQKDATVETVFARLAPLEAKLGEIEGALAARDPQGALDRFAERLEALQGRVVGLEVAETPFAAISEQLTRLYAQKDATVETVFARLAPLEAKLASVEGALVARDPQAALERFAERLEAARAAQEAAVTALGARVTGLEGAENPFAAISEQLTRLYAQKDATVETVFARLAPLEAKLGEIEGALAARDPQGALDRFAERLEALQGRVVGLEVAETPFAAISEQLTRLYAQKDATVETVFARLAPLEAKLASVEGALVARDPQAALERFAERLEAARAAQEAAVTALGARVTGLEGAENPFAAISEQLTRLYAQKDATVETVFARLAPLEAKLGEIEGALAARDPQGALDRFAERLEAARAAQEADAAALVARVAGLEGAETPFAAISEQLTRLYAQKDAGLDAAFARLAPLEARLEALERAGADEGAAAARAEAQAIAAQLVAARTVAEETRLFASRITLLEASLPRLSHAQALMMQALERQAAPAAEAWPLAEAPVAAAPEPAAEVSPESAFESVPEPAAAEAGDAEAALWRLPRIVSVHKA